MNAHQFAKLTQRQKLEHIARAKRVFIRKSGQFDKDTKDFFTAYTPTANGIVLSSGNNHLHRTREAALTEGKRILAKLKTEAQQLGIPVNQ